MPEPIGVLMAASEVSPLAQTGGLAEVAGSLPRALTESGLPTAVIMPGYRQALAKGQYTDLGLDLSIPMGAEIVHAKLLLGRLDELTPIYLVQCDPFFDRDSLYGQESGQYIDNPERFAFFSKVAVEACDYLNPKPDVLMANDWQTGLTMPYLVEKGPEAPKGLFVIHNQGFLGLAPFSAAKEIGLPLSYLNVDGLEYYGQFSYLKAGIVYSKLVVTVSPTYALEIQTPEGGHGLDGVLRLYNHKLHGILNGVNYSRWNPKTDPYIAANYDADDPSGKEICKLELKKEAGLSPSDRPLFSMVSRLTAQKGLSLLIEAAADLFKLGIDLVILGSGDAWFEERLTEIQTLYPERMRLTLGYDAPLSHKIMAASDFVLVPSIYEPCGLIQLYALGYGAIPVVRAIGGLNDTIRDFAGANPEGLWDNGFKFSQFQAGALVRAVRRATELYEGRDDFKTMMVSNMREDFSWNKSALSYAKLIRSLFD
ncbi:MAG: glycogen synthase GlgA [Deltaproteobacteria bacterium]|jgi:starch synthase|nr:glycogen synthase GlgA [Deltaproteobacteria bacterium]